MKIQDLSIEKMLPFLEDETLIALAKEAIDNGQNDHQVNMRLLVKLGPFLPKHEVDIILYDLIRKNIPVEPLAPFASKAFFGTLVDMFLAGQAENVNIDALYPFMEEKDIKRLFAAVIKQRELDRQKMGKIFEPEKKEEPTSDEPEEPDEPNEPNEPNEPDEPDEPNEPDEPDEPEEPEEPDEPDEEEDYGPRDNDSIHITYDSDELTKSIEEKVKKRLFAHFFGRNTHISEEVKKQFESAMED